MYMCVYKNRASSSPTVCERYRRVVQPRNKNKNQISMMKIFPHACLHMHVHMHTCIPACCQSPSRAALAYCGGTRPVHETPLSLYA